MELSQKQKINGRRSTESKIVVADDALTWCLWSRYFIEGKGYLAEKLEFHLENMSTVLMENNGKESSTNQTNHI